MCYDCEYSKSECYGYKIHYFCTLTNETSEVVATYFNENEMLIQCPKDSIKESMIEVNLIRSGKLPKKTWKELRKELKK